MSISALSAGLSAPQGYQSALDSSAHNIANASTNGFTPEQASFSENTGGGVKVSLSHAAVSASAAGNNDGSATGNTASGTDLNTEMVNSIQYQAGFNLNAKVVKTADQVLGTLINIKA